VLTGCSDPDISNLGKLLIYTHIENSFVLGAKMLDFMAGADTWKKLWNFSIEKTYQYEKTD
jgi:CelD/BcsL family acetyltransferase involved in cellulose biosynthesis